MALLVLKFGGTSLANIDRMKNAVQIINKEIAKGNSVVVVVSAMAGVTDDLVRLAGGAMHNPHINFPEEYDAMLATGEIVSSALLSMLLAQVGVKAQSMQGWQIGLNTDDAHSEANIQGIETIKLRNAIRSGITPIVCGFQGVHNNRITTLGRGGSDTTAVGVAAALGADRCDIYTDVDGIYSADPNIAIKARRYNELSYDVVVAMGYNGAKVMHPRAVEIAKSASLTLRVLSSLSAKKKGTIISNKTMENTEVTAITSKKNILLATLAPRQEVADVLEELSRITYSVEVLGEGKIIISCDKSYEETLKNLDTAELVHLESSVMQVAVVGHHIRKNNEILRKVFQLIKTHNIRLLSSSVNDICLVFWLKNCENDFIEILHDELILQNERGLDEKVA